MRRALNNLGAVVRDDKGGWICGLCVDPHASYRGAVQCRRDAKHAELEEEATPQHSTRSVGDAPHLRQRALHNFGFWSAVKLGAGLMLGAALMYLALMLGALLLGAVVGLSLHQLLKSPN